MAITKSCSCGQHHPLGYKCPVIRARRNRLFDRYKSQTCRKLRASFDWTKKSLEVRRQALHICEVCRDKKLPFSAGQIVDAHHITPVNDDKKLLLDDYNICVLCRQHHAQAEKGLLDEDYLKELARKRIETARKVSD